jgi:hypothetical protein
MNTQTIKQLIYNTPLENAVTKIDQYVIINLDWLTSRNYQSQGINELLFVLGQTVPKIFIFLIRDGVNCRLTGIDNLIKIIVDNYNLDKETCWIYGYEDLAIENATFIKLDVVQMWCSNVNQVIANLPIANLNFSKKFAALFGRHELYRLKFFRHLYENYHNDSVLSYNSNHANWNFRFEKDFADDQKWFDNHCPVLLDFEKPSGWVSFRDSLEKISKHYNEYFIEIVCETDPHSNLFFTEKSLKNFYLGKPFLLFSGPYSLQNLKRRGFLTFKDYINEEYDTIQCPYQRYVEIVKEIDRLAKLTINELSELSKKLYPIFEHNRERFVQISHGKN